MKNGCGAFWVSTIALCLIVLSCTVTVVLADQEKAEVFVQYGHDANSVAFSTDGRFLASGGYDHTIKLWDVKTGREIRTLKGHSDSVDSVAFSPDGRYLASGSDDNTIKLWDGETGKVIHTLKGHSKGVSSVVISFDGRSLASGSYDETIKLWDIETGMEIRTLKGHSGGVTSVAFSSDGRSLASGSYDKTIKLWDTETGREVRTIKEHLESVQSVKAGRVILTRTFKGHSESILSVAFSPDGLSLASGSEDNTIKLWDVKTGEEIRTLEGHSNEVSSVAFSLDGRSLASGSDDNTIKLWDVKTGEEIRTLEGHSNEVFSVAFSPDGRYLASGSLDSAINLWDTKTGSKVRTLSGHSYGVDFLAFSPDGRYLASGSGDNTIRLWDAKTGTEIRTLSWEIPTLSFTLPSVYAQSIKYVHSVAFSPDDRYLAAGCSDSTIKLWDVETGMAIRTLEGHSDDVFSVAFSPNGRYLASGSGDNTIKLWDIETGREVRTLKGHWASIRTVVFSPDGRHLASGSCLDNKIKLWDVNTGKKIRTFKMRYGVNSLSFNSDGRHLAAGGGNWATSDNGEIKLFDTETGKEICILKGHSCDVSSVAFSPDGRYLVSGYGTSVHDSSGTINLWNAETGKEICTLTGHRDSVKSVSFSLDGLYLSSGSWDGTVKLWGLMDRQEVLTLTDFKDGEWLAITPDGYYNASPDGDKYLNVRIGPMEVVGIDQYRSIFYQPDIVEAKLKGEDVSTLLAASNKHGTSMQPATISDVTNFPPPMVIISSPGDGEKISGAETDIQVIVKDESSLKKIELFINGKSILEPEQRNIVRNKKDSGKFSHVFKVSLDPGENSVLVRAHNQYAFGEDRVTLYRTTKAKESAFLPRLFILSIGAADYKHLEQDVTLNYTTADAREFAAAFDFMKGKLFREIHTKVLAAGSDLSPTADNIEDSLDFLAQAGQYDVAILFLAGHGIRDSKGRYYFLPEDATPDAEDNFRSSSMVKWSDIMDALDIPATTLAFIDTCHSGSIFKSGKTRSVDNNQIIRELLEQGTIVFASSTGSEFSLENSSWGHGAFTYAILQGLQKGRANLIEDSQITWKELDTFVSSEVVKLTNGAQHPVSYAPEGPKDFALWLLGDR